MRVYSADPAGLLPGEGCGVVVLARSADARAAGVPVYAELAGWSTPPVTASALAGSASLLAYRQAGIDPADIQLIEGQGTGTAAADSAELAALAHLRRGGRTVAALGAVSAGIGYTKAAAGIASLVKTAVVMAAGTIPPATGCVRPHPLIESGEALLRLPPRPEPWPDGTRLAAVNSLGTADPAAAVPGCPGFREAEGVHLVLRREGEANRWPGRRRRAAEEAASPPARDLAARPGPSGPGRHTTPARPARRHSRPRRHSRAQAPQAPRPSKAAERPSGGPVRIAEPAQAHVFAFCGAEPGALADRLDVIAASATVFSDAELRELAALSHSPRYARPTRGAAAGRA